MAEASSSKVTLDSPDTLPATAVNELLSYPEASSSQPVPPPSQPRNVVKERLYVGNLHPTVDELTLIKLFSQYGKVSHLDYLFHKTGPHKGKPRGYAFVEYSNSHDADAALRATNDKLLRGRKIVVTYANQAPMEQTYGGTGSKYRKSMTESGKPTTLSLMKSGRHGKNDTLSTRDKIAQMEAKLKQMERTRADGSALPAKPIHPSLPAKPAQQLPSSTTDTSVRPQAQRAKAPLPTLPLPQPVHAASNAETGQAKAVSVGVKKSKPALLGVKFKKPGKA